MSSVVVQKHDLIIFIFGEVLTVAHLLMGHSWLKPLILFLSTLFQLKHSLPSALTLVFFIQVHQLIVSLPWWDCSLHAVLML